jgi:predicted nucleotidyltransferase
MNLPEAWRQIIVAWAERNECVREVWLFGSRVKGNPKKNDVDLAIYLMPPTPSNSWPSSQKYPTDWAREQYSKCWKVWQRDLSRRIGGRVELVAPLPDTDLHSPLVQLWARPDVKQP